MDQNISQLFIYDARDRYNFNFNENFGLVLT